MRLCFLMAAWVKVRLEGGESMRFKRVSYDLYPTFEGISASLPPNASAPV